MVLFLATVTAVTLAVTVAVSAVGKIVQVYQDSHSEFKIISCCLSNKLIVVIDEPEIYEAVEAYLGNKLISKKVIDYYQGYKFKWEKISEAKAFKLTFRKKIKDLALQVYLPYIMKEANLPKEEPQMPKEERLDPVPVLKCRCLMKEAKLPERERFESLPVLSGGKKALVTSKEDEKKVEEERMMKQMQLLIRLLIMCFVILVILVIGILIIVIIKV